MNIALLFKILSVFSSYYPEIQALIYRIYEEFDKMSEDEMLSSLNVSEDFATLSPEFLEDLQQNHSQAVVMLEQKFDENGEVMASTRVFGTGALLSLIPWLVANRDAVIQLMNLFDAFRSGEAKLSDLIEMLLKMTK